MIGQFEVRNADVEDFMRKVGALLKEACPPGWVFSVLVASVGEKGACFYISNGDRESMIGTMQEFIQKHREN